MAKSGACPECGAQNAADARRCRICAALLNASIPEVEPTEKPMPEHIQRLIDAEMGDVVPAVETYIPGYASPASPASDKGFGGLPPPPSAPGASPAADRDLGSLPPPPSGASPATPPGPSVPEAPNASWGGGEDGIVIEVQPRYGAPPVFDPEPAADDDVFDPDALWQDFGRDPLPPPPVDPDEIRLPPRDEGPDPLWAIADGRESDLSTEEITRLTKEALREERLRKRPGFLNKVFKPEDDSDDRPPPPS